MLKLPLFTISYLQPHWAEAKDGIKTSISDSFKIRLYHSIAKLYLDMKKAHWARAGICGFVGSGYDAFSHS